jgi:hypothetical protein
LPSPPIRLFASSSLGARRLRASSGRERGNNVM